MFSICIQNRLANSQRASVMTGGGFFRSTKFRYSGRTEREILTESLNALRQQLNNTSPSKRKASSVPATPSSPQGELSELRMMNCRKLMSAYCLLVCRYINWYFWFQAIAVYRDQQCQNRLIVLIVFIRIMAFHAWKQCLKKCEGTLVSTIFIILIDFYFSIFVIVFYTAFLQSSILQMEMIWPITTSVMRTNIHRPKVVIWQIMMHSVWHQIVCTIKPPIILHFIRIRVMLRIQQRLPINKMLSTVLKVSNSFPFYKPLYPHSYLSLLCWPQQLCSS